MSKHDWEQDLDELSSAEDFLEFFRVDYDARIVHVNRLHILQRFHDYLANVEAMPEDADVRFTLHADLLENAYQDFVRSDAATEKVFKVFHAEERKKAFVPLSNLLGKTDR